MIHTVGRYHTIRAAFVDGVHVPMVFYADTDAGFVRYYLQPQRANRRKTAARWAKKRGRVEVYKLIDPPQPNWLMLRVHRWALIGPIRISHALYKLWRFIHGETRAPMV